MYIYIYACIVYFYLLDITVPMKKLRCIYIYIAYFYLLDITVPMKKMAR